MNGYAPLRRGVGCRHIRNSLLLRSYVSFSSSKSEAAMPSLQDQLPPELYRVCLRRAKFIGHQKHNSELLVGMIRQQFRRHKHGPILQRSKN